ncbi:MAG: FKBP-type peptidyl-prolyl cis-trans isomerase [Bacteroidetes bacterium]|nr:FKBP-type peptidyl-prolyl cis-trans isomerase [Bacteroidota bacterium]
MGFVSMAQTSNPSKLDKKAMVSAQELKNAADSASYAYAIVMANNINRQLGAELNKEVFLKTFESAFKGEAVSMTPDDAAKLFTEYNKGIQARAAQRNREDGQRFLAENKKRPGVITTASGLQYEVLKKGTGTEHPKETDKVEVHYHGTLIDGSVFDSSVQRGAPAQFVLNGVIKGWTEGVQLMVPGDKFKFFLPSELAYGDRSAGQKIKPGSTLIFEVELLQILKQ